MAKIVGAPYGGAPDESDYDGGGLGLKKKVEGSPGRSAGQHRTLRPVALMPCGYAAGPHGVRPHRRSVGQWVHEGFL